MTIIGRPPNFLKILRRFPEAASKTTIFAYAPNIYIAAKMELSKSLEAHENVHIERQESYPGGVETWWDRYLIDKEFRFEEELIAHRIEYKYIMENGSRSERRIGLKTIAGRLSSSLYGLGVGLKQAITLIGESI